MTEDGRAAGDSPGGLSREWPWLAALAAVPLLCGGLYFFGGPQFQQWDYWREFLLARALVLGCSLVILTAILQARRGAPIYIRRIPGLGAVDETVGRATEMGRPITFSLGLSDTLDIVQLQAIAICLHVVKLAIRFGTRVIVTTRLPTTLAVAQEAIQELYASAGRPESFNADDVRFLSNRQFAYASAMMGVIVRERSASNYMFGEFFAESLILAEAGQMVGAIQVAGTPSITQIPFFIATCDYTIIGDEYYAATAYLTREKVLCGSLAGQDRAKIILLILIAIGIAAGLAAGAAVLLGLLQPPAVASLLEALAAPFQEAQ